MLIEESKTLFLYIFFVFTHTNFGEFMEKKLYNKIVMNHKPKEHRVKNALIAFFIGGLMGVLGHFLLNIYSYYLNIPTADASIFMIIT